MGGYAEDALLAGSVTRPHGDFDWLLPRSELELRQAQAERLGFSGFDTWGEAAPGVPFYLFTQTGDLKLEIGIADEEDGALWVKIHRLFFQIGDQEPPAGYRVRMPDDTFDHPPVDIDDVTIRVASPLALYRLRVSIASQGSFGELSDRQRESSRLLREKLLADRSESELAPQLEPT